MAGIKKAAAAAATKKRFKRTTVSSKQPLAIIRNPKSEVKRHDVGYFDVPIISGTPNVYLLSGAGQGTAVSERVGRKVEPYALQIRSTIFQKGTDQVTCYRMVVVADRQNNGGTPAASDYFASVAEMTSPRNQSTIDRFVCLMDKFGVVNNQMNEYALIDEYIKLDKKIEPLQYLGITADVAASSGMNAIYVFIMSDYDITWAYSGGTETGRSGLDFYSSFLYRDN